jgi:hypothetical protein
MDRRSDRDEVPTGASGMARDSVANKQLGPEKFAVGFSRVILLLSITY